MNDLIKNISDSIESFFSTNDIYISEHNRKVIINRVLSGEYAFQIIYDVGSPSSPVQYSFKILKPLNIELLQKPGIGIDIWMYDRGTHKTAYGLGEVLVIDRSIIRDIKLNNVLENGEK